MKNFVFIISLVFCIPVFAQYSDSPLVSFDDYESLIKIVKEQRKSRLVDLNTFNEMSAQNEVYILDTRTKEMYDRKHVKGAIHLNFSDFTQANLDALFPNRNATILIYCNNNFMLNRSVASIADLELTSVISDESFASKVSVPNPPLLIEPSEKKMKKRNKKKSKSTDNPVKIERADVVIQKPITLALNIPTYINLYGYGYQNVYELSELISVSDERIQFEGTDTIPSEN